MWSTERKGFTLFELIAVLTVSGILFMVIMGSYNSWSAVHACNGASRILKSGLRQARTLSMAKNQYVAFEFSSFTTNRVQHISEYRIYLCTNDTGRTEQLLAALSSSASVSSQENALNDLGISPAAPPQRLSGHVRLGAYTESTTEEPGAILFFRPDGSVWNGVENTHHHFAAVYSRRLFDKYPLTRLLQIDLASGGVEIIREENTR